VGGGKRPKKGGSAALRRALFRAGCVPGWLLQLRGFGPDPAAWRRRVSRRRGWVCCRRVRGRGESGETRAGVLVLACLAARSASSGSAGLALQLGCGPVGVHTELLWAATWLPPLDPAGGLLPSPPAPEQTWGQSAWERPSGDAGSLGASLVSVFTAGLDLSGMVTETAWLRPRRRRSAPAGDVSSAPAAPLGPGSGSRARCLLRNGTLAAKPQVSLIPFVISIRPRS